MSDQTSTMNPTAAHGSGARHPSAETWAAYYSQQVPPAEQARLQEHLVRCPRCVDLVLDLETFAQPASEDGGKVSDFEKAAVWRALKPHLETARWPKVAAMAASLIFATLGFSAWTQQRQAIAVLETRVSELSQPWANVEIRDLSPSSRQRSARGADATTPLPADGRPIALILNLEEPAEYPGYEARIIDGEGDEVHRLQGLEPSEFDNFYLALPPHSLSAGKYELRLFGVAAEQPKLLETYPIELR